MSKKKKLKIKVKIEATTKEIAKLLRDIDLEFSSKSDSISSDTIDCSDDDFDSEEMEVDECYAQTDCEASDQFDDSAAQDIVLNQMAEAINRGADPFPMMSNEGIEALKDITSDFLGIVIPVQDLIQVLDVVDDVRKEFKESDENIIFHEYEKVCYLSNEVQRRAEREFRSFESRFESKLFLVDFLLSHFYPDNKRIKIKLADGYTPQVFVVGELDKSNEGYSAELRVRDKNEEGKYEAIRGFVKPDKAINFKLFC